MASGSYERRPIHAHIELCDAPTVITLLDEYEYKLLIGLQLNGNRYYVQGWFAVANMSSAYDLIFSNPFLKRTGLKLFIADPTLWKPQMILAPEETPGEQVKINTSTPIVQPITTPIVQPTATSTATPLVSPSAAPMTASSLTPVATPTVILLAPSPHMTPYTIVDFSNVDAAPNLIVSQRLSLLLYLASDTVCSTSPRLFQEGE